MRRRHRFPRRSRAGFTVVELLVATAVTLVLAAMLIGITSGVMSVWNRSRGSLTSANQAKIALDQLATDLEGAILRSDGRVWFAATILESNNAGASLTNVQLDTDRGWVVSGTGSTSIKPRTTGTGSDARGFVLDAPSIEDCRFGLAGTWLRFFTTRQDDNSATSSLSAPVAVSYQISRRRVSGSSGAELAYMLYRSAVRPEGASSTFTAGFDLDPAVGAYVTGPNQGDPGTVVRPHASQILANNVIDFGVRLFVREGASLRLVFPARPSTAGGSPVIGTPSDSTPASAPVPASELQHLSRGAVAINVADAYRNRLPDVAEVMVRMLSDEGAQLIRRLEAGQLSGVSWWDIAETHSQVYTRRIEIRGRGL